MSGRRRTLNEVREELGMPQLDDPGVMFTAPSKPYIGAIVHRQSAAGCQAAIVTRVHLFDGGVDLNAFGPSGVEPYTRLPEGTAKGSWHWPEVS